MLGAIRPIGSPRKQGRITRAIKLNLEWSDLVFSFFINRQPDRFQRELVSGSAEMVTRYFFSVHNRQRKAANVVGLYIYNCCFFVCFCLFAVRF